MKQITNKEFDRFRTCNCCGKKESYPDRPIVEVTCNCTEYFWEHDTRRNLCKKCEKRLKKLMTKTYFGFFKAYNEVHKG